MNNNSGLYKIAVVPRHVLILLVSVVFQLLCFSYIYMSHYFDVSIYLLFILTLPIKIKRILLLVICFAYGVLLDLIFAGGGLFAMTTTFIGYIRPSIVRLFFVRDESYSNTIPTSNDMGVVRFIIYTFITVFAAMLFFYVVENISLVDIWRPAIKALLSTIVTVPVIFFTQLLLIGTRRRR